MPIKAERRTEQIMISVEPTIATAIQKFVGAENISTSSYCRNVIIRDLLAKGLLTESMLADLASR